MLPGILLAPIRFSLIVFVLAAPVAYAEEETTGLTEAQIRDTSLPDLSEVQIPEDLSSRTKAEIRGWQMIGRQRKEIAKQLRKLKLTKSDAVDTPSLDDHFVVAIFHASTITRTADVRFITMNDIDGTALRLAYYISTSPRGSLRLFQVLDRRSSETPALASLERTREQYEDRKPYYQNELLKLLRGRQAVQSMKMRRC